MATIIFLLIISTTMLTCADRTPKIQALIFIKLNLHDPLGALYGWDSSTPAAPCDCRGVFCTAARVCGLQLPSLQLAGKLTDQISNLQMLRKLSLRSNYFNDFCPQLPSLQDMEMPNPDDICPNRIDECDLHLGEVVSLQNRRSKAINAEDFSDPIVNNVPDGRPLVCF